MLAGLFHEIVVNTMATDTPMMQGAGSSALMELPMYRTLSTPWNDFNMIF